MRFSSTTFVSKSANIRSEILLASKKPVLDGHKSSSNKENKILKNQCSSKTKSCISQGQGWVQFNVASYNCLRSWRPICNLRKVNTIQQRNADELEYHLQKIYRRTHDVFI
ncbi:hypothetical protein AVEN_25004-1 [Araneus ventricosus]|uniref:Uncharacterized protein n=1 Tax=Araneus ventricosus TaxID=182803 RepID=A0A4Y2FGX7_ARAVE|nr:hypothetical protein AVEN_25004-1 [Araneus ventricosus]